MVAACFPSFLLLGISCENIFALFIVTACPFSSQSVLKRVLFYVKTAKICWRLGASPPAGCAPAPLPNPGCATVYWYQFIECNTKMRCYRNCTVH